MSSFDGFEHCQFQTQDRTIRVKCVELRLNVKSETVCLLLKQYTRRTEYCYIVRVVEMVLNQILT